MAISPAKEKQVSQLTEGMVGELQLFGFRGGKKAFVFQLDAKKKKSEIIMQHETNTVVRERALPQVIPRPSLTGAEFPRA